MLIFLATLYIPPSREGIIMASRSFSKGRLLAYWSHEKATFPVLLNITLPGPLMPFHLSSYSLIPRTFCSKLKTKNPLPPFPIKRFFFLSSSGKKWLFSCLLGGNLAVWAHAEDISWKQRKYHHNQICSCVQESHFSRYPVSLRANSIKVKEIQALGGGSGNPPPPRGFSIWCFNCKRPWNSIGGTVSTHSADVGMHN